MATHVIGAALKWAAKVVAEDVLHHLGEAIGTRLARHIDPNHNKETDDAKQDE